MAFMKTGIGVTKPTTVHVPKIGDKKDNLIWNGKDWVTEEQYKNYKKEKNHG